MTMNEGSNQYYNALETPPLPPGFTGGMPPNVTNSGYSYGGTDPSYNADAHWGSMGMNPAEEMLQERMTWDSPYQNVIRENMRILGEPTVQFLPDYNISTQGNTITADFGRQPVSDFSDFEGIASPSFTQRQPSPDLFELDRLARNARAMQQQEGLGIGSPNPTPYISSLEGIPPLNALQSPQLWPQPANEMMNGRMNWQQSPAIQLGQSPAELLALQDMTRQSSSGYNPTNIWDYNPMWPVESVFDSGPFPTTPGHQGILDPLFLRRWNEGYKPALSNIANAAMYTNPYMAPMNAWWNLATRNR